MLNIGIKLPTRHKKTAEVYTWAVQFRGQRTRFKRQRGQASPGC
jgi:hypothetical protein